MSDSEFTKPPEGFGGWLDPLVKLKVANGIIMDLQTIDKSATSVERLTNTAAALLNIEANFDSKIFKLLSNHFAACKNNPACASTLQEILDLILVKK